MTVLRPCASIIFTLLIAADIGCSSEPGGAGSGGNAGAGGSSGGAGSAGTAGTAGTTTNMAGSTPGGSSAMAGSSSGGSGAGGAQGGGGTAGGTGGGGSSAGGMAGTGKGSAAKNICAPGATYGDPLMGMGAVNSINPPPSDYFAFIEGPIWISSVNTLFFSDNASSPSERVFKLVPPSTTPAILIPMSGSNGLGVDNDDHLIATDQRNKRIVHFDPTSGQEVGTAVSTGSAKPNDVIERSDGNVYFTDPDSGFYRISPAGAVGDAMKLTQSTRPNGIALSLDESSLFVGDVGGKTIAKYSLGADGSVMAETGAAFIAQTMNDTVDGLCMDCAGNLYASTSNGVEVYSPQGMRLGVVPTGEASNCTFGGADRKTLFVTSRSLLKSVTLAVPGLPD